MKRIILITLILLCLLPQACFAGSKAKKEVKNGNLLYNKGKFEEALKRYEEAFLDLPDSAIVNFDLGTALYKTEDYKSSIEHFERSLVSGGSDLEQKASYNLGNANYKFGIGKEDTNLEEAINLLEKSLKYYEHAIELDPEDEDAKYNYEFVKKELERLKKQEQQSQQQEQPQGKEEEEQKRKQEEQRQQQGQQQKESEEQESKGEQDKEQPLKTEKEEPEEEKEIPAPGEISEDEAEMILDSYRHEEEPKGTYQEKIPIGRYPEVLKDW